jgi:branched-chain amino acid transport system substrate-binding protein
MGEGRDRRIRLDRRRFLGTLGSAGTVALAGCTPSTSGAAATPGAPAPGDVVKIGFVSPESGVLAPFGETDQHVVAELRKHFARNPVQVGGRPHRVEILKRDSQSDAGRAGDVAADLILNDGVHVMLASATPDTVNPVSDQCEASGTPCVVTMAPWQPWFFGRGALPTATFDWTYLFFWGLEDVEDVYADMWDRVPTNRVAAALWAGDSDGLAWSHPRTGLPQLMADSGYPVVDPGNYRSGTRDFGAQIAAFQAADAQVLVGVPIPPDFRAFWRQAAQLGYHPRIATVGKAMLFPSVAEELGPLATNLCVEVSWSPSHPYTSSLTGQTAADLAAAYSAATGRPWSQPLGFAHALFEVAVAAFAAVERVDDRRDVAEALGGLRLDTVVGPLDWTAGPVRNVARTPLVGGQWRPGPSGAQELVIVSNSRHPEIPVGGAVEPLPPPAT